MTRGNFPKVSAILHVGSAVRLLPDGKTRLKDFEGLGLALANRFKPCKCCKGTLLSHATARGKPVDQRHGLRPQPTHDR